MADPLIEAERDRAEAERLRWEERQEPNAQIRKDFERAAVDKEVEAEQIESEVEEANAPEEP